MIGQEFFLLFFFATLVYTQYALWMVRIQLKTLQESLDELRK